MLYCCMQCCIVGLAAEQHEQVTPLYLLRIIPYSTTASHSYWFAVPCRFAQEHGLTLWLLGRGSNTLFHDHGFGGMVVVNAMAWAAPWQDVNCTGSSMQYSQVKTPWKDASTTNPDASIASQGDDAMGHFYHERGLPWQDQKEQQDQQERQDQQQWPLPCSQQQQPDQEHPTWQQQLVQLMAGCQNDELLVEVGR